MYRWLWTHLPGSAGARACTLLVAAVVVVALLMTVVFPWVATWLPFDQVDVGAIRVPLHMSLHMSLPALGWPPG